MAAANLRVIQTYKPCLVVQCEECGVESFPPCGDKLAAKLAAEEQGFEHVRGKTYCARCAERTRGEP